jgi:hypothetical protein
MLKSTPARVDTESTVGLSLLGGNVKFRTSESADVPLQATDDELLAWTRELSHHFHSSARRRRREPLRAERTHSAPPRRPDRVRVRIRPA